MPRQVVLIEDRTRRHDVEAVIRSLGLEIVRVEGGADALKLLRGMAQRPAAVLMDLVMLGLDAVQFRRAQLQDPHLANIPLIIMTVTVPTEALRSAAGVPLLRKPFTAVELKTALDAPELERSQRAG